MFLKKLSFLIVIICLFVSCTDAADVSVDEVETTSYLSSELDLLREEIMLLTTKSEQMNSDLNVEIKRLESKVSALETEDDRLDEMIMYHIKDWTNYHYQSKVRSLESIMISLDEVDFVLGYARITDGRLYVNKAEWINSDDADRINALGLKQEADFPNGFYIFDEVSDEEEFIISSDAMYFIYDDIVLMESNYDVAKAKSDELGDKFFVRIIVVNGNVMELQEMYIP